MLPTKEDPAQRVVILANRADPESIQLAQYYAEKRSIPLDNIFAFKLPPTETISWPEFVETLWQPFQDELIRRRWIDAVSSSLKDDIGRKKTALNGHRISYLVVCRGVPLRIANDPSLVGTQPNVTPRAEFRTNQAAVDSELALLPQSSAPIIGYVPNPLFRKERPGSFEANQVIKVSRLDGPTYDDARALVDHALEAEHTGALGRAYVDIGGIYPEGDRWLESTAGHLGRLGFDPEVDRLPTTFDAGARFDAPFFYFGWYANDLNGPFALPGFHFPPGAIALHIHSFSAHTLHSATVGWSGPLVARGVTATVGNVYEPYLQLTHDPSLLLDALALGKNFGDAAAYSCFGFSWQAIAIGDPLYQPFAVSLEDQLAHLDQLPADLAGYAVLRRVNLLEIDKKLEEALALLRSESRRHPSFALGLAAASRLELKGDRGNALAELQFASRLAIHGSDQWALVQLLAQRLEAAGAPSDAMEVYRKLLAETTLPSGLRVPWLQEARHAALAAKDLIQAAAWEKELDELNAPPAAKEK